MDWPKVAEYLATRVDGARGPMQVRQFPGGSANLTYLISFGAQEFVLRRPPLGPVAPGAHDMAREHKVLSRLLCGVRSRAALVPSMYRRIRDRREIHRRANGAPVS